MASQQTALVPAAAVAAPEAVVGPGTTMTIQANPFNGEVLVHLSADFTGGFPMLTVNFRKIATLQALFLFFESVELVSVDFRVRMMRGDANTLYLRVYPEKGWPVYASLATMLDWFDNGTYGVVEKTWSLPSGHSFGKEAKASNIGNQFPVFNFLAGPSRDAAFRYATLWSAVRFRCRGVGPTPALQLSTKPVAAADVDQFTVWMADDPDVQGAAEPAVLSGGGMGGLFGLNPALGPGVTPVGPAIPASGAGASFPTPGFPGQPQNRPAASFAPTSFDVELLRRRALRDRAASSATNATDSEAETERLDGPSGAASG